MEGPNPDYPESDFPWTFYFNGVALPKWSGCWFLAGIADFFGDSRDTWWDWDVGPRDIWTLYTKIDHVGTIESAEPDVFLYAVQEVLCVLFAQKEAVIHKLQRPKKFKADENEIYQGLVDGAFAMRELLCNDRCAFWTSGYEGDRLRLMQAMQFAALDPKDPNYQPPPHVHSRRRSLEFYWEEQAKLLHRPEWAKGLPPPP